MVNKVILIGNLAADPDVKATPKGMYVANIRLATHTYLGKDEEGKAREETEYHRLVAFGKLAEFAGQYLKKGRAVYAEGRLRTSSWEDTAGGKRFRTEIVVDEFKFVGSRPQQAAAAEGRDQEETRDERIRIAREAERQFERKVAWGARCGDEEKIFTTLSLPVMTRLRMTERSILDTLVAGGVARSRSEALAWCVRLVGMHQADWIKGLRDALVKVDEVRSKGPLN